MIRFFHRSLRPAIWFSRKGPLRRVRL